MICAPRRWKGEGAAPKPWAAQVREKVIVSECDLSVCLSEEPVALYGRANLVHATFAVAAGLGVAAARVSAEPWQDAHAYGGGGQVENARAGHACAGGFGLDRLLLWEHKTIHAHRAHAVSDASHI